MKFTKQETNLCFLFLRNCFVWRSQVEGVKKNSHLQINAFQNAMNLQINRILHLQINRKSIISNAFVESDIHLSHFYTEKAKTLPQQRCIKR